MTNIEHRTYSPGMDVRAAALSTAPGHALILHRAEEYLAFVPLRDVREGVDLNVSVVRDLASSRAVWTESDPPHPADNAPAGQRLRVWLIFSHEPVLVLRGEGDAEREIRKLVIHRPAAPPRSVLDTLRGGPDLEEFEFTREAEDRVLDFAEEA